EKKRRRFLFFWLIPLLIGAAGFFLWQKNSARSNPTITATPENHSVPQKNTPSREEKSTPSTITTLSAPVAGTASSTDASERPTTPAAQKSIALKSVPTLENSLTAVSTGGKTIAHRSPSFREKKSAAKHQRQV